MTSNLDAVDKLVAHVEELCAALQVFFLQRDKQANGPANPTSYSRLTERLARAFCLALCPYLKLLKEDGMAKLGLRVTLETQQARAFLIGRPDDLTMFWGKANSQTVRLPSYRKLLH